jgi:hypothetical protein
MITQREKEPIDAKTKELDSDHKIVNREIILKVIIKGQTRQEDQIESRKDS